MPIKKYIEIEADVEGHATRGRGREIVVDQIALRTTDGEELTLEPEGDDEDRWRVISGSDDLVGHAFKIGK